uniref:Ig-like domain-containing protein n=1 Tax=Cairina moschata TaxID=8855 RepID=A0A8C3BK01_CAIMO
MYQTCTYLANFFLLEPPQFLKRIENISSLRGGTVVFQAAVKGSLPITVSWLKDNDEVIEDNNIKMTFVNNIATLLGSFVHLECIVSGSHPISIQWYKDGQEITASENGFLTVKGLKFFFSCVRSFVQMPTPIVALREGQSTTFECQIVGTPEIHVTWYLDGNEVTDGAKYVTQARVSDSGIYVCEAHNDAGSESCSIELKVKGWS